MGKAESLEQLVQTLSREANLDSMPAIDISLKTSK